MAWVNGFIDRLRNTNTLDDVQTLVAALRDDLGVEHAVYHQVGTTGREHGALTYDPAWVAHYKEQRFYLVDPVVRGALGTSAPLDWRTLDWKPLPARRLLGEAVSGGVGKQGLSVPVRGPGGKLALFTVTSYDSEDGWDRFNRANEAALVLAANYIHSRTERLLPGAAAPGPRADLSPREVEVLTQLAVGRSRAAASDSMGISEHTFRAYLDTARIKLGAQNTVHAVALALTQGYLLP